MLRKDPNYRQKRNTWKMTAIQLHYRSHHMVTAIAVCADKRMLEEAEGKLWRLASTSPAMPSIVIYQPPRDQHLSQISPDIQVLYLELSCTLLSVITPLLN